VSALTDALMRCWYGRCPTFWLPLHTLLAIPLSWIFGLLAGLRRVLYRVGLRRTQRLPVAVIVVGNITVGGSGKTPLTITLVHWLCQAGYTPGIVSRGYGGSARAPMPVAPDSDPALVVDEPVLLARRAGCPVWIGRERAEAARQLLMFHPQVDVLIADDGLQHLALARDIELVVVDAARGFGNGRLLPAGPLREPLSRLATVDAMVINGQRDLPISGAVPRYAMRISGTRFVNLARPQQGISAAQLIAQLAGDVPHAIAGISHPDRFFDQLTVLGIKAQAHAFADHHAYVESDLPAGTVLMTEKDAVKCAAIGQRVGRDDLWFLAVDADVAAGLQTLVIDQLNQRKRTRNGPKTA